MTVAGRDEARDEIPVLNDVLRYGAKRSEGSGSRAAATVQRDAETDTKPKDASESSARPAARSHAAGIPGHRSAPANDVPPAPSKTARLVSLFSHADWEELERKVRESVLNDLQMQIDQPLQQHIENHMIEAIDQAMTNLSAELKSSLRETLHEAITEAVSQEIALLQNGSSDEARRP